MKGGKGRVLQPSGEDCRVEVMTRRLRNVHAAQCLAEEIVPVLEAPARFDVRGGPGHCLHDDLDCGHSGNKPDSR